MVAARARGAYDKQAKERQRGGRGGKLLPVSLPEAKGDSRDQAAKAVGVSGRTVDYATRVLNRGTPELIKAERRHGTTAATAYMRGRERREGARKPTLPVR